MEYRVLGPLEVSSSGQAVNLGGPKPRSLVAILLAARGRVVSASALAEDLWSGDPPTSAASTLQAYVSRLRTLLPPDVLRSESGGYRLVVAADELDADRFEVAVAEARAARALGQTGEALLRLDFAEAQWRGAALPELADAPAFRPEAARLDELRLTAMEERFALQLEAGRHAEAVPELEAATQQHPLREALHAALMLALYRSGRQTDALRAFQVARVHLAEQVGLDPGPELARLEDAILTHDPALALDADNGAESALAPPPLPSPLTSFLGRSTELADLSAFVGANRLVTLVGAGGAGKSRLALEVATEWSADRPDAWIAILELVALNTRDTIGPALRSALGLLPDGPPDVSDVAEAIGSSAGLLIVDNAEHLLEPTATICTSLLTACPELRIVATSRAPFGAAGEAVWRLGGLAPAEAVSLFCERAGRVTLPDDHEVAAVCARLDGLPLPLELAAARLRHMSFAALVSGLESRLAFLDEDARSDRVEHHRTVTASVEWSLGLLSEPDRRLVQLASVFDGGFEAEAVAEVAALAGGGDLDVVGGLARLVDNSLLELVGSSRYRMLETVRAVSSQMLEKAGAGKQAADAHLAWMAALAAAILDPSTDEGWWIQRMKDEVPNVRAALTWAVGEGDSPDVALRLATRAASLWILVGSLEEGTNWLEACLPRATKGTLDYARALNQLAVLAYSGGDSAGAAAPARESLRIARALGDLRWVSIGLNFLGAMALDTGELAEGRRFHIEALAVARGLDPDTVGSCLVNLACAHLDALEYEEAAELLEEAADLFDQVRGYAKRGSTLCNLAITHRGAGNYAAAEECLRSAYETFRQLGDQRGIAYALNGRAMNALGESRFDEALDLAQQSLVIARERGDRLFIVDVSLTLAKAHIGLGCPDVAAAVLAEALSMEREIGSRMRSSAAMTLLAGLAASRGAAFEARAFAEQALAIAREMDNPNDAADAVEVLDSLSELASATT